jgi:NO-binding membrane sensor protein with MHYT domain
MRTTIAGLCFTDAPGLPFTHNRWLVGLSYLIAVVGCYAALEMAERLRTSRDIRAQFWLAGSALTLGGSIWAMHFMAMLALQIAVPVTFDPLRTALSLALAVGVVAGGLTVCARGPRQNWRIAAAGTLIGLGVAAMHYLGMAAIRFPGSLSYRPGVWGLSLLIAIAAATVAMWLALNLDNVHQRVAAALVMALAVCGMHYTGMAAAVFEFDPEIAAPEGIAIGPLSIAVTGISLALFLLAYMAVAADRRLLAGAAREEDMRFASSATAQTLRLLNADLDRQRKEAEHQRTTEQLLASVFVLSDAPMAIVTTDGMFLMTNPKLDQLLRCPPGSLVRRRTLDFLAPASRPRIAELRRQQQIDRLPYGTNTQLLLADSSVLVMRLYSAIPEAAELHRFSIITFSPPLGSELGVRSPAASGAPLVVASMIRFVSLAEIRSIMGDDWDPIAETVMSLAEEALGKYLMPNETFSRSPNLSFVIRFADATEQFATERAEVIQRQLNEHLLQLDQEPATVETVVVTTSVKLSAAAEEAAIGGALNTCLASATLAAPRRSREPFEANGCQFEPILACGKGQLIGYFIRPDVSHVTAAFGKYGIPPSPLEIEAHVLAAASEHVQRSGTIGRTELLFVEVAFGTFLERAKATSQLELYRSNSLPVRDNLVIMLSGLPPGIPVARIHDIVGRLSPLVRSVGFCLEKFEAPDFDVGLFKDPYLAFVSPGLGEGVPDIRISQLAAQLHARSARCLVRRVPSMDRVHSLRSLGVDAVSIDQGFA